MLRDHNSSPDDSLSEIRAKFIRFLIILENNNQVLKVIGDMEEKCQGDYLFDTAYIVNCVNQLRQGVSTIIDNMIELGGDQYLALRDRFNAISSEITAILPDSFTIPVDDFVIPLEKLSCDRANSVGSKSAQLGEMKTRMGLSVPNGFAISAWSYRYFMETNGLADGIARRIASLDVKRFEDLIRVSREIQSMVSDCEVPNDLAEAIRGGYADLRLKFGVTQTSLRSSAIGEDTRFSFAGQYPTFLNIREDEVVECYRDILAGKFTPQAIYYLLNHTLSSAELAMGVCCVEMVDAVSSGVVYTRDPVDPENGEMLVSSVFGLGKYLVDGTLTPDQFRISRDRGEVVEAQPARKPVKLVNSPEGGTEAEPIPKELQTVLSLQPAQLEQIAQLALKIEEHYHQPRDIEFAIDREGKLFFLQNRPLQMVMRPARRRELDLSRYRKLVSGGKTVCPGAGSGQVYYAASRDDLANVPVGAVLIAPHPFPGLVTAMGRISALITRVGAVASHMATLAREYRIPTIVGLDDAESLPQGETVTVDATEGVIYEGVLAELIESRGSESGPFSGTHIYTLLKEVLSQTSPLNLIDPSSSDFTPSNCKTLHDLTRFIHQKAMEEMMTSAHNLRSQSQAMVRLKSVIPLDLSILYIDRIRSPNEGEWIEEDQIGSLPLEAFWSGLKEGWPLAAPPALKGFKSAISTRISGRDRPTFSLSSVAISSREYMVLSLRMGYHLTTIEAMCTDAQSKNYIRMQYQGGGSAMDRRIRRVKLLTEVLVSLGFENAGKGDFLDASIAYLDQDTVAEKLKLLGRLTFMTKQLDMALSNDDMAQWYIADIKEKLGKPRKKREV